MAIRAYFDGELTQEWGNNLLFRRNKFTTQNNVMTQRIWIQNTGSSRFQIIGLSVDPTHNALVSAQTQRAWCRIGTTPNNIAAVPFTPRAHVNPGKAYNYYIQVTIPTSELIAPGAANVFPVILNFTVITDENGGTEYRFRAFLDYEITPSAIYSAIPNGIVIVNKDQEVIATLNNIRKKFEFGYNRAGGNDDFTLSLRADWDQEVGITRPVQYDDQVLYVHEGKIWYRGVINRIRTRFDIEQSIELSGTGLSKQLGTILVSDRFTQVGIKQILITLLEKYLESDETPLITYDADDIEDITTTTTFEFKNETLFSCIQKIASVAGANPTGEGGTGTDIIWGVDENSRFYFKKKSLDLKHQLAIGQKIKIDDPQIAPRFNRVKIIGDSSGVLQNLVRDGDCEETDGSIDRDFEAYWAKEDPIQYRRDNEDDKSNIGDVEVVTIRKSDGGIDTKRVAINSQAYKWSVEHEDAEDPSRTFGSQYHPVLFDRPYRLSFYARTEGDEDVTLIPTVRISSEFAGGADLEQFVHVEEMEITNQFKRYVTKQFDVNPIVSRVLGPAGVPLFNNQNPFQRGNNDGSDGGDVDDKKQGSNQEFVVVHPDGSTENVDATEADEIKARGVPTDVRLRVMFPVKEKKDEKIVIDGIYLYQESAKIPEPTESLQTGTTRDEERIGFTQEIVEADETDTLKEDRIYNSRVFANEGQYEIIVEDYTAVEEFGRVKEAVRELDSISRFEEAYEYAKAILGESANVAHRATLSIIENKEEAYNPYDNSTREPNWGHVRVFGGKSKRTEYEYSIIEVKHTVINDTLNTSLSLGAPKPDVSGVVRHLTARERYQGEASSGGAGNSGAAAAPSAIAENPRRGDVSSTVVSKEMPTNLEVVRARAGGGGEEKPVWVVPEDQESGDNRANVNIRAVKEGILDAHGDEIPTTPTTADNIDLAAGTQVEIRSNTDFLVITQDYDTPAAPSVLVFQNTPSNEQVEKADTVAKQGETAPLWVVKSRQGGPYDVGSAAVSAARGNIFDKAGVEIPVSGKSSTALSAGSVVEVIPGVRDKPEDPPPDPSYVILAAPEHEAYVECDANGNLLDEDGAIIPVNDDGDFVDADGNVIPDSDAIAKAVGRRGLVTPQQLAQIKRNMDNIRRNRVKIDENTENIKTNKTNIETNKTNIEENKTNIEINKTNIEINETNIETNRQNIVYNREAIEENAEHIQENKAAIGVNRQNIQTNQQNIQTNTENIETNKTNIETNTENIETNTENIETNTQNIANHETRIAELEACIQLALVDASISGNVITLTKKNGDTITLTLPTITIYGGNNRRQDSLDTQRATGVRIQGDRLIVGRDGQPDINERLRDVQIQINNKGESTQDPNEWEGSLSANRWKRTNIDIPTERPWVIATVKGHAGKWIHSTQFNEIEDGRPDREIGADEQIDLDIIPKHLIGKVDNSKILFGSEQAQQATKLSIREFGA